MFGANKALCLKVEVEVQRPLLRGVTMVMEGRPRWIMDLLQVCQITRLLLWLWSFGACT